MGLATSSEFKSIYRLKTLKQYLDGVGFFHRPMVSFTLLLRCKLANCHSFTMRWKPMPLFYCKFGFLNSDWITSPLVRHRGFDRFYRSGKNYLNHKEKAIFLWISRIFWASNLIFLCIWIIFNEFDLKIASKCQWITILCRKTIFTRRFNRFWSIFYENLLKSGNF